MSLASQLAGLLRNGVHRIGEIDILTDLPGVAFALCHFNDVTKASSADFGGLQVSHDPNDARELSTLATDGEYRFAKAEPSLRGGWLLLLENEQDLLFALDQFYPASVALHLAEQNGTLGIQHLRDKFNRQTGMYERVREMTNEQAQVMIQKVCGPAARCARKILWQIDPLTPLEDSEASRFNGVRPGTSPVEAIPLLCREACNHFVAEARRSMRRKKAD